MLQFKTLGVPQGLPALHGPCYSSALTQRIEPNKDCQHNPSVGSLRL